MRAILTLALLLGAAAPAHAVDKRAAAAHFQRGRALFDAGSWSAALDAFNAGYEAYPLPGFLVNIGQCQRRLDRLDEAAAAFQKFLDSEVNDPRLRAEVQEALSEVSAERQRRMTAEIDARRQRDEAERRHPLVTADAPQRANLRLRAAAAPPVVAVPEPSAPVVTAEQPTRKSRRWVWAIVGVLAAGAAASAVTVAVIETQPQPSHAGSLGLLDGRR